MWIGKLGLRENIGGAGGRERGGREREGGEKERDCLNQWKSTRFEHRVSDQNMGWALRRIKCRQILKLGKSYSSKV